jgi:hypothetical protein
VSIAFWMWLWGPMGGFVAVPSLLVIQSIIMHVFPSTANVPKAVQRRLEARTSSDPRDAPAPDVTIEVVPVEVEVVASDKPKRPARKAAIPASS